MGFDRTDDGEDAASADHLVRAVPTPEHGREVRERDSEAGSGSGLERGAGPGRLPAAGETPGWKLTAEERIAASHRARATADAAYAAWERETASRGGAAAQPARLSAADGDQQNRAAEDARRGHVGGKSVTGRDAPDKPAAAGEALRHRVSELEADKAARDQRLAEQDKTIAEQDKRIARLERDLGRVAEVLGELRGGQGEARASADIKGRFRGEEAGRAEWKEEQHKRRLPTDAVNNAVSAAVGSAITALPYQVHDLPPEVAGIAAGGVALGAGIIAVWRERRKAKDDADHRPGN